MKNNIKTAKNVPLLFSHWSVNKNSGLKISSPSMMLGKWNNIIVDRLDPTNINNNILSPENITMLIKESEEDHQTIRTMLITDLTEKVNVMDKDQYVKINQGLLIRNLDKLFEYSKTRQLNENMLIIYHAIGSHLQITLDFMEEYFSSYFDHHEKVPEPHVSIAKEGIKRELKNLRNSILKQENTHHALFALIVNSIQQLLQDETIHITYSMLSYQKMLLRELINHKVWLSNLSIFEVLYYLNYNEENFIMYEYTRLNKISLELQTNQQKITTLLFEQKKINQYPTKPNCCYNSSMPSIKEQINGWINEEVKFLENVHSPEKVGDKVPAYEEKINTSLSVAKLAIILKLLVIDKIIINRTIAPMLRIAAKIFTTLQTDEISFGSLETKYHANDKAAIQAVKDMLYKWINILNRL